jgi:hypothetical protein
VHGEVDVAEAVVVEEADRGPVVELEVDLGPSFTSKQDSITSSSVVVKVWLDASMTC